MRQASAIQCIGSLLCSLERKIEQLLDKFSRATHIIRLNSNCSVNGWLCSCRRSDSTGSMDREPVVFNVFIDAGQGGASPPS